MKTSTKAVLLNTVLPGAGLLYLQRPLPALLNFVMVTGICLAAAFNDFLSEHIHYVVLGAVVGSGGLAHAMATSSKSDHDE